MSGVRTLLASAGILILCANAATLVVLQALPMATLFGISALVSGAFLAVGPSRRLRFSASLILFLALVLAAPLTLNQVTIGLRAIGDEALADGAASLSYPERAALWWSSVWLSIGGLAYGAPHAVAEQVLMFWDGPDVRVWRSDFPTDARQVRDNVVHAKEQLGGGAGEARYRLGWKSYCEDDCDVGLALNGGSLIVAADDGGACVARASVDVCYKPRYRSSTILSLPRIGEFGPFRLRIDQAAFWALQEVGWLHPYKLTYRWRC